MMKITEQIEHAERIRTESSYSDATVQELAESTNALIPLWDNGVIDEIWGILRKHGEHRHAEELTRLTNRIRAALNRISTEAQWKPN